MKAKQLINFSVSEEKKTLYKAACSSLGISVSDVCRKALDNAISLSEKLKTPAPQKEKACSEAVPSIDGIIKANRRAFDALSGGKPL